MIRSALLDAVPGLGHAMSERGDGAIGPPRLEGAAAARAALVRAAGGQPSSLVVPAQVHGAVVRVVGDAHPGGAGECDALATTARGVPLLVQGADCPLLVIADTRGAAVAVVHSGWRGTVARISAHAVSTLDGLGATRADLAASVFPGIGPCCYEIGGEVRDAVREALGPASDAWLEPCGDAKWRLDLRAVIVGSLLDAGLQRDRIDVVPGCTACDGRFFSHRRSGGAPERHGVVALRSPSD